MADEKKVPWSTWYLVPAGFWGLWLRIQTKIQKFKMKNPIQLVKMQKVTWLGWNSVLGKFRGHWLRTRAKIQKFKMADPLRLTKMLKLVTWLGWNFAVGYFWHRWLRVWARHSEIQNFGCNMAHRIAKSKKLCREGFFMAYIFQVIGLSPKYVFQGILGCWLWIWP